MNNVWQLLDQELGLGQLDVRAVGGGCINQCAVLTGVEGQLFVKTNSKDKFEMFVTEHSALQSLAKVGAVRVPEVFERGVIGEFSYLALEYIPMGHATGCEFHLLGEQLARLHLAPPPPTPPAQGDGFGWNGKNFIGATPQLNRWTEDWAIFFAEMRIGFQLELAADHGPAFAHGDQLVARVPDLLAGHEPQPSLLHGDLWSGNVGFANDGTPVIYDPACYFGDRETDIAFSEMFGGFPPEFYSGYRATFPLDDGYEGRRDLYNLYHVLNHYNLFGGSYREQAEVMIRRLLVGF